MTVVETIKDIGAEAQRSELKVSDTEVKSTSNELQILTNQLYRDLSRVVQTIDVSRLTADDIPQFINDLVKSLFQNETVQAIAQNPDQAGALLVLVTAITWAVAELLKKRRPDLFIGTNLGLFLKALRTMVLASVTACAGAPVANSKDAGNTLLVQSNETDKIILGRIDQGIQSVQLKRSTKHYIMPLGQPGAPTIAATTKDGEPFTSKDYPEFPINKLQAIGRDGRAVTVYTTIAYSDNSIIGEPVQVRIAIFEVQKKDGTTVFAPYEIDAKVVADQKTGLPVLRYTAIVGETDPTGKLVRIGLSEPFLEVSLTNVPIKGSSETDAQWKKRLVESGAFQIVNVGGKNYITGVNPGFIQRVMLRNLDPSIKNNPTALREVEVLFDQEPVKNEKIVAALGSLLTSGISIEDRSVVSQITQATASAIAIATPTPDIKPTIVTPLTVTPAAPKPTEAKPTVLPTATTKAEVVATSDQIKAAVEPFAKATGLNSIEVANSLVKKTIGPSGKQYEVMIYPGKDANDPWANTFVLIREKNGNWGRSLFRHFEEDLKIKFGTDVRSYMTSSANGAEYLNDFTFGFIDTRSYGTSREKDIMDKAVLPLAPQINTLLLHHIISPDKAYPSELENAIEKRNIELTKKLLRQYIIDTIDQYPKVTALNLVNESRIPARSDDRLMQLLGEDYILYVYRVAREYANEKKRDIKLLFSETGNHYPGQYTDSTLYFSRKLAREGLLDAVAVQGHLLLNKWTPDTSMNDMKQVFSGYPKPVWITEADANLTLVGGSDEARSKKLAQEYGDLVEACIDSNNCEVLSFFNGWDSRSWLENGSIDSGSNRADGTLYSGNDINHERRMAYYKILNILSRRVLLKYK